MTEETSPDAPGILRAVQIVTGIDPVTAPLGTDDFLRAWPLQSGDIEQILFIPHAWLRAVAPDWFGNLASTDQITVIFSYPLVAASITPTPYVEVVRERPLVTVRCPPGSAILQALSTASVADPDGQLDLVIYKDAGLAYGHYEISDSQDIIRAVMLALVADPGTYINAIGAASTDPNIAFKAAESLQEIRVVCQYKSNGTMSLNDPQGNPPVDPPEVPGCTMFTGTYVPDGTNPDSGTVVVDTVWAADWPPPPVPPQPVPDPDPLPDPPPPPDPPQSDPQGG